MVVRFILSMLETDMVATLDVIGFADAVALKPAPMGFAALVPAEYFTPPPPVVDPKNGKVGLNVNGSIFVTWGRGCPIFDRNLAAARRLKAAGHGNWNGQEWTFGRSAVVEVLKEFAALVIDPAVANLVKEVLAAGLGLAPKMPEGGKPKVNHGSVTLDGGMFLVKWGNTGTFIPRPDFDRYLDNARQIKGEVGGRWDNYSKGWRFPKSAAGRIVLAFPVDAFTHCPEVQAEADKNPHKPIPAAERVAHDSAQAGTDALASNLLANADDILGSL